MSLYNLLIILLGALVTACSSSGESPSHSASSGSISSISSMSSSSIPMMDVTINAIKVSESNGGKLQLNFILMSTQSLSLESLACEWTPDKENLGISIPVNCLFNQEVSAVFMVEPKMNIIGRLSVSYNGSTIAEEEVAYLYNQPAAETYLDASSFFNQELADEYYLLSQNSQPNTLYYLPKQLVLDSNPGVASVQRRNVISSLEATFLQLSSTDWGSEPQAIFSSRYAINSNMQSLVNSSGAAGFSIIKALPVQAPIIWLENKVTLEGAQQENIHCNKITQLIDQNPATLLDCYLERSASKLSVNNINYAFIERPNFNSEALTNLAAIRGVFNIALTLPGTKRFNASLENNGSVNALFGMSFLWPLMTDTVSSANIFIDEAGIHKEIIQAVSDGKTTWSTEDITLLVDGLIKNELLKSPFNQEEPASLVRQLERYIKQDFFVSAYSKDDELLFYIPRLRLKAISADIVPTAVTLRYFSEGGFKSALSLECLSPPDFQNNIYSLAPNCIF